MKKTRKYLVSIFDFETDLSYAIAGISHHYNSDECAKSNIYSWIRSGVIKGLYIENKKIFVKNTI